MTTHKKIKSMEELKSILQDSNGGNVDGCIASGILRSSKTLWMCANGSIQVFQSIDGSVVGIEDTNIPDAIEKGSFYVEVKQ